MLLAAGRGERMRPLTDTCPKPLLMVQGKPLMQWHLEALARAGYPSVVVNTAWLADRIEHKFNAVFGLQRLSNKREQLLNKEHLLHLHYSSEGRDFGAALETAGGIARALPHLGDVFWLLAGDVFTPGFDFAPHALARLAASDKLAHLWLVPNPPHNPGGDFGLQPSADGSPALALNLPFDSPQARYTYSTIGVFRRALFEPPWCDIAPGNPLGVKAPLAPLLRRAMDNAQVTAELYTGPWTDVGTPQRLAELNAA
ncbi:nucleotidyltransferase family protein [Rhodoferax sp.]|uniref:nucleotidyltransferase family protein n=1 Tax=Rhodoferax sp. TaxID=50421 RepID=UPI00263593B6|nr:nucleotidyltransferase family protein [Rhodoferax sp.]MDD2811376.1 nucleotidyltransferase family protein [Rhodoferax sp.]